MKHPWSPLKVPFKPPSSLLQALRSLLHLWKASSSLQAPLKLSSSHLQAPLKPSKGEAPFKPLWSSLKPPSSSSKPPSPSKGFPSSPPFRRWSPLEAFQRWSSLQVFVKDTFKGCFAEGEAPFVTEECPSWRSPERFCVGWCLVVGRSFCLLFGFFDLWPISAIELSTDD